MTTFDSAENFGYFGKCLENPPTPRNNLGGSPSKLTKRLPAALKICNGILRQGHRSSRAKMRYHIISYPNCLGVPKSIFSHLRRGQLKLELRITECCRLHNVIFYKKIIVRQTLVSQTIIAISVYPRKQIAGRKGQNLV